MRLCLRLRIVPSHDVHRRAKVCESGFADKKGPDTSTASQSHGDADLERSMRVTSICLIANVVLNALGCLVTLLICLLRFNEQGHHQPVVQPRLRGIDSEA